MGSVRVMFIGQGPSNLPADRVVNVFHFHGAATADGTARLACMQAVDDFYTDIGPAGPDQLTLAMGAYISPWVARTAELRSYDLDEPGAGHTGEPPRTPIILPLTLPTAGSVLGLPEEMALCLTLHGAPPNSGRRRGRLYFGPIIDTAISLSTSGGSSVPTLSFITNLEKAARQLRDKVPASLAWSIRSTVPAENFVTITGGYIDTAMDVQRRRGPESTFRQVWTT